MSILKPVSFGLTMLAIVGFAGYAYTSSVVPLQDIDPAAEIALVDVQEDDPDPSIVAPRSVDGARAPMFVRRKQSAYQKAVARLKDAESEKEKDEAIAVIRKELEKQYDEFLVQNEKQLEQMQERLDKLRAQLQRRKRAKDRMVDLRLETVIGEAEGLIWPSNRNSFWRAEPTIVHPPSPPSAVTRPAFARPAAMTFEVPPSEPRRRSDRMR